MKRYLCSLVALGLLQGVTGQVKAQRTYSFTTLDVPGSSFHTTSIDAYGINDSGQIVGDSVLLDNGSYLTLAGSATGINNSGRIVGYYGDASGDSHGFLLDNGNYTTLDPPGSVWTLANGINASDQIVGYYRNADGHFHGFMDIRVLARLVTRAGGEPVDVP
jgi:probable HAF family extracellular repeat protein